MDARTLDRSTTVYTVHAEVMHATYMGFVRHNRMARSSRIAESGEGIREEDGPFDTNVVEEDGLEKIFVQVDAEGSVDFAASLERHVIAPCPATERGHMHVEDITNLSQNDVTAEKVFERLALFIRKEV